MAPSRTRNVDSDGPSTADVSANEDVEMQEQKDRVNGFPKFGVSARFSPARNVRSEGSPRVDCQSDKQANCMIAVLPGHARLHGTISPSSPSRTPTEY